MIDDHVKYLEEEIEIRIESMKIELDEMFKNLKEDLHCFKRKIIE